MESFVLRVNDNEYRVAMPTAQVLAAEKQLGESLISAVDRLESVAVQHTLLWAGLQKHNHGITMDKVSSLMDAMRSGFEIDGVDYADFSVEPRIALCTKILVTAGFFTETDTKELDSRLTEPK
jgi:hypothetical protein